MIYIEALEGICRWDRDLGIMTLEPKSVMTVQELQRIVQIRSICIWWQLLCGFFFSKFIFRSTGKSSLLIIPYNSMLVVLVSDRLLDI